MRPTDGRVTYSRQDFGQLENPAIQRRNGRCRTLYELTMFLATISFRAQPHKRAELLSAVDDMVERMRQAIGCERCRLLVDTEDPNSFLILSEWRLGRDAEHFLDSRDFHIFKGVRILLRDDPLIVMDEVRSRATRIVQGR